MTLSQERWLTLAAICVVMVLCIFVPLVGVPIAAWLTYRTVVLRKKETSFSEVHRGMAAVNASGVARFAVG